MARRAPARAQTRQQSPPSKTPLWAIGLVVCSTLFIATAHLLLKYGLEQNLLFVALGIGVISIAGVMVTLAFKHGELSALHALFGLGFLWATVASILILHESVSATQVAGIAVIVLGVGLIGRSGA